MLLKIGNIVVALKSEKSVSIESFEEKKRVQL
jgi:hypothetical protein